MSGMGTAIVSLSRSLLVLIPLAGGAVVVSGCSAHGGEEEAALKVANPFRDPPSPRDTQLHLLAGEVEACDDGDWSVEDVTVDEGDDVVVVGAQIRTSGGSMFCELREFDEPFVVNLSRPLGQRAVIDRSSRTAIWSPERRARFVAAQRLEPSDAEALLRSKLGPGPDIDCSGGRGKYFSCSARVPSRDLPVSIYVFIRAGGAMKPSAGEKLPPELRNCNDPPRRSAYKIC